MKASNRVNLYPLFAVKKAIWFSIEKIKVFLLWFYINHVDSIQTKWNWGDTFRLDQIPKIGIENTCPGILPNTPSLHLLLCWSDITFVMWKKFNFFTAELLQSTDPGSPLFAIQVWLLVGDTSPRRHLTFPVWLPGRVILCLGILKEESHYRIKSFRFAASLHTILPWTTLIKYDVCFFPDL